MFAELFRDQLKVENFKLNHSPPEDFWICLWQKEAGVSLLWIFYRLFLAVFCLAGLLYSLSSFFLLPQNAGKEYKYLIFVTHWTFTVETVMFLFALCITVAAFMKQAKGEKLGSTLALKVYWVLYTTVLPPAFLVTFGFWMFVYDKNLFSLNVNNIILHATNSLLILLDFFLVIVPYRLLHFYMPFAYAVTYFVFSAIYEMSGGTGVKGMKPIYKKLDWKYNPSETAFFVALFAFGVFAIHAIASVLYVFKLWCRRKYILKEE